MRNYPPELTFVLLAIEDEEAEQAAREKAWEARERAKAEAAAKVEAQARVVPLPRRSTLPPPPTRRAA